MRHLAKTDSPEGPLAYGSIVTGYEPEPHHIALVTAIWQALHDHQDTLILMPAGAAKTTWGTTTCISWAISMFTNIRIGLISQTDEFASDFSTSIMQVLEANEVQHELFGDISHGSKWRVGSWRRRGVSRKIEESKDMTVFAGGTGGQIASKRFDVVWGDDILGKENTATVDQREKAKDWFDKVLIPRRIAGGVTIIFGTRWAEDDLYQTLMTDYGFRTVIMQALIEVPEEEVEAQRAAGEVIVYDDSENKHWKSYWESNYPVKTLLEWRKRNPANFDCVYQQDVEGLLSGDLFNRAWYLRDEFYFDELPDGHRYTIRQGGDLASSTKERADYTATVISAEDWCGGHCSRNGHYYVLYEDRDRIPTEHMEWFANRFDNRPGWCPQPAIILLEKNHFQSTVVSTFMKERPHIPVSGITADADKRTRATAVAEKYRMGYVHHHRSIRGSRLEREQLGFPKGHDDLLDACGYSMNLGGGGFFFGSLSR